MLCYVVIGITGRCQNWLLILSKSSIFHLKLLAFWWRIRHSENNCRFLPESIAIKDGQLFLPRMFLSSQQLNDTIDYLCTSWFIVDTLFFWSYVLYWHITIRLFVCYLYRIYVHKVRINITIIIIIGSRRAEVSHEPWSTSFLRQRISVAIQRGNAACINGILQANLTVLGLNMQLQFVRQLLWLV